MSFQTKFYFHDTSNLPDQIFDFFMMYLLAEGLNAFKNRFLKKQINFRKTIGWLKISFHVISIIITATLEFKFEKIHLKPLVKICNKLIFYHIALGLKTFVKTEPELSKKIFSILSQLYDDYKIYKTTGVKTSLIQRWLPNLT